jgi:hypothetical protein
LSLARERWRSGDIEEAREAALGMPESAERRRLLFDCAFAKGDYEEALAHYAALPPSYARRARLDQPVIDAYLHLGRLQEAADFARARGSAKWLRSALAMSAAKPLRIRLETTTVLPFVEVPLMGLDFSDSLPGVEAELEGERLVAHFDSGGSYLVMRPERAKLLGIELIEGERSFASLSWGRSYYGLAKSFRLGDALLENVPVYALPQLSHDKVFFGTNILERFLATVDFPARRLTLSPRGSRELKEEHYASLPGRREEVPFYLWGDHFMFARGGMGTEKDLNFFIDSGLFAAVPDGSGAVRRAAFLASREACRRWGMDAGEAKKGYFEYARSAYLGGAEMPRPYVVVGPMKPIEECFGGVRIDGLLSNGFLGEYAWTIDFDRRVYIFSGMR